jgi:hypothetical protein
MSTIRFFLDEDVWPGLAVVLREHSFDAIHAYELERGEISDADDGLSHPFGRGIILPGR